MDLTNKAPVLVILMICIHQLSGVKIPQPEKLEVNILEGEFIAHWKRPAAAPTDSKYNVQMAKYTGEWAMLAGCTGITDTHCDLSSSINDYRTAYKVRVHLVDGDEVSPWTAKKIQPNAGKLQPPSFTLWATSSTLMVFVHKKPILSKLYQSGLTYTIYLEEPGTNKNTTAYLNDGTDDNQRIKTFTSLHWGKEYCVSIMAEPNAVPSKSSVSPKQCLHLPEQEWFIVAVASLSILGVITIAVIMTAIILCYLKSPRKTPTALKSPVSGWLPLSVKEGPVEVVTDKGWFLSGYRTEVKNCEEVTITSITSVEKTEEEDRRTSMDSGVSLESNSVQDSGCGSMGGSESSTSSQAAYPLESGGNEVHAVRKREDSGVGMTSKLDSSCINVDGPDSGQIKDSGVNYHSQSPLAVQMSGCDEDKLLEQILPESNLAEVVTGYRVGPQSCICSNAGQCSWCHKQGRHGAELYKQHGPLSIEDVVLDSQCGLVDSFKGDGTFSRHLRNSPMDSVLMDELRVTFLQLGDTFPLVTSMPALPLTTCGQDFNMSMPLSLCDVQLQAD